MNPLSGVLTEAWGLYRRYAVHFLSIAFVIFVVDAVIEVLLRAFAGGAGYAIAGIISAIALFLVEAALVTAIQDVRDGRVDLDFGQTISAALPFLLPVAAASILWAIGVGIGLALLIVPGLILMTFWSLIVPAIVIGRAGPFEAFSRSWRTVRGYAWQVFGTYVLVFLIWIAALIVLGAILLAIPVLARDFISNIVSSTLVTPFLALVVTLIYYRLTAVHAGQPATAGAGSAQPPAAGWSPQPPPPPAGSAPTQPPPAQPPGEDFTQPPPAGGFTQPPPAQPRGESFTPPPPAQPPGGDFTQPPPAQPPSGGFTRPAGPPAGGSTRPYPAATPPPGDVPQPPPTQPAGEGLAQPSPEPEEDSPRPPAAPPSEDSGT